ncbi:MAG: hypothetical protein NVS2B14_14730 [Chamaesiphon sp.]
MRYAYVNSEVERTTGMPASAFIGKTFQELEPPQELYNFWKKNLDRVFETGQAQAIEFNTSTVDGLRTYQSRVVPEFNNEGFTQSALVVSRDITAIKQAEAEIRSLNVELEQRVKERTAQLEAINQEKDKLLISEQAARNQAEVAEQRFRELVNGLADAIVWECDAITEKHSALLGVQFSFVSQSAEVILGYPLEQWLKEPNFWINLIHPDDREWVIDCYREQTAEVRDFEFEYRTLAADGRVIWLRDRAYIVRDERGQVEKLRGLMIDITQRKQEEVALKARADELARMATVLAQTNAVLEKRNHELDQFAYVTSHDLKAPLRAIANLSQWIEEDIEDRLSDETRHQMNLLRGRVNRLEALIDALLSYSRVGRLKTKPEIIDIKTLLSGIIDSLAPPPEFKVEVDKKMPRLVTELLALQQVFSNLIDNAIKHHPRRDGQVKISVEDRGNVYEFAVADDGCGIAHQYHEKIFVIFQTLQARDKVGNISLYLA